MIAGERHVSSSLAALCTGHGEDDDRVILTCEGRHRTARQLTQRIACLSRALSGALGAHVGSRVMLIGFSSDHFIEALLAIMDAGGIAVPINYRWSAVEVAEAIRQTRPVLLMVDAQHHAVAAMAAASAMHAGRPIQLLLLGDRPSTEKDLPQSVIPQTTGQVLWTHLRAARSPLAQSCGPAGHHGLQLLCPTDGAALICFTSGTTGQPKGVVLSHQSFHVQSLAKLAHVGYCRQDVYLHLAPLFHVGGLSSLMANLMAGSSQVWGRYRCWCESYRGMAHRGGRPEWRGFVQRNTKAFATS